MVAHVWLRTREQPYGEIVIIIGGFFTRQKEECYEEVANNSRHIFTLIQNNNFCVFSHYDILH